jgi:hypothetical protein
MKTMFGTAAASAEEQSKMKSSKLLAGFAVIGVGIAGMVGPVSAANGSGGPGGSGSRPTPKPNPAPRPPGPSRPPKPAELKVDNRVQYLPTPRDTIARNGNLVINVRVPPDKNGQGGYEGRVDLMKTIDRIRNGGPKLGKNDGEPYNNKTQPQVREKPPGYWREYVVETPGMTGPGKQRLLVGGKGEIVYTNNHYKTWRWISNGKSREN